MKRVIIIAVIVVAVIGLIAGFRIRANANVERAITTEQVKRTDFVKTISSSGKIQAEKSVDLKFQTSGKLQWVGVAEGDTVSAYQAIATLDRREVQKNLEKALRDYSSERNDFEELWRVTYTGHTPENSLTDTMKRILEKNQWDLEKAVLDVELKQLAVEYATLITPIAGIVTHIDTPQAGVNITPAASVFSVSDPTSLVFTASVDETEVSDLSIGLEAVIMLDAFPEATFSGTISYISLTSELSSGGATVFPVKIKLSNQEGLRIGFNGDVTIETKREPDVLVIPTEALREDKGETYVFKKVNKAYVKTPVKIGERNEDVIIILAGLEEKDLVVTKGFTAIKQ